MHEVAIVEMFELTSVAEAPGSLPLSGRIGQNILATLAPACISLLVYASFSLRRSSMRANQVASKTGFFRLVMRDSFDVKPSYAPFLSYKL